MGIYTFIHRKYDENLRDMLISRKRRKSFPSSKIWKVRLERSCIRKSMRITHPYIKSKGNYEWLECKNKGLDCRELLKFPYPLLDSLKDVSIISVDDYESALNPL